MRNLIKFLIGISVLYIALVVTGDLTGMSGGIVLQRTWAQRGTGTPQAIPSPGGTFTDPNTGVTYNVGRTVSVYAPSRGYNLCNGTPITQNDPDIDTENGVIHTCGASGAREDMVVQPVDPSSGDPDRVTINRVTSFLDRWQSQALAVVGDFGAIATSSGNIYWTVAAMGKKGPLGEVNVVYIVSWPNGSINVVAVTLYPG